LDGGALVGGDIRRDFYLAFKCSIVASAAFMRGIATGRPGAGRIFSTRGLNENVSPGDTELLNKVFDGRSAAARVLNIARIVLACRLPCQLVLLFHHPFKRCWRPSGFIPFCSGKRISDIALKPPH
jgi:hypothetical protein